MSKELLLDRRNLLKGGVAAAAGFALDRLGLGRLFVAEAGNLPEDLPPHIAYHREAEQKYLEGSARIIKPLAPGEIWIAQTQKIRVMGVDFNINPEANPGRALVFAIGAATNLDLDFTTVQGVYAWTGLESSPRTGRDFVDDIGAGGRTQVARAQLAGNCTEAGCTDVTLVMAVGHRDADGIVRFDSIPNERYTK